MVGYFDAPLNKKFFLKLFSLIGIIIDNRHDYHTGHGQKIFSIPTLTPPLIQKNLYYTSSQNRHSHFSKHFNLHSHKKKLFFLLLIYPYIIPALICIKERCFHLSYHSSYSTYHILTNISSTNSLVSIVDTT